MAGNTATRFSPLITIIFTTTLFLFLSKSCLSNKDQLYLDCAPQTCGDGLNISFPFYIKGQQKPYCGYPGFDLSCNTNNHSIFDLSNNNYVVHNIFYTNQSLRISYPESSGRTYFCFRSVQNFNLSGNGFEIAFNNTYMYLWFNCSSTFRSSYVMDHCPNDKIVQMSTFGEGANCSNGVKVPVELYGDEEGNGFMDGWEYYRVLNRGFLLNWTAPSSECGICQQSGGRCGFDEQTSQFNCFCPDMPRPKHCSFPRTGFTGKIRIIVAIAASAAGFGVLAIIAYCYSRKFSSTISLIFWKKKENQTRQNIEDFLRNIRSFTPKRYSYSDVKKMTNSFKDKLGQGGFGAVYKGKLHDDRLVAVKILNNSKGQNGEELVNELASISRTSHVNIVTLLGFCFDGSHRALIYEFMSNGSLEKFIYDEIPRKSNRQLGWETLYRIAIGIARGLE